MRGKHYCRLQPFNLQRITPAGAGKTSQKKREKKNPKDHPRRCGENSKCGKKRAKPRGSPPQVRGKHADRRRQTMTLRITPAGAGKTGNYLNEVKNKGDHPRRCGENRPISSSKVSFSGSPPQVRGKHCIQNSKASRFGITPAGAGKTVKNSSTSAFS